MSATNSPSASPSGPQLRAAFAQSVRDHWVLFLIEGIVMILLGALAIALPQFASLAVTIFVGWLLLLGGVTGLIMTFWGRHAPGFWWSLISALLALVAGGLLLWWPFSGELSLTLVLIVFFTIDGIMMIMLGLEHRRELSGRWGWLVANGIIDLILAGLIFTGYPGTAAWAIGLLFGIDLVFGGSTLLAIALGARRAAAG